MTMDAKRLSCYLLIFFSIQVLSYAASFYGTSFIHLPLEDVSSENEISFQFRTSRTRGLLFMAVGQTDYCIIQIESSRIHVWMQVGSGEIHMTLDQKIKVNDLEWHQISIEQLEGSVKLSVDQKFSKIVVLPGNNYVFDVTDGIYIGGTSIYFNHTYSSKVEKSFRGCIENVLFNNIDVFQLALETDDATSNDITPNCSAQFVAAPNDPISFLSDTAYLQMPRWAILTRGSFACWLKTSVSNGLILYQGGITEDFIAVELKDGKVRTTFNRGSGAVDFSSSIQIDNSNWHYLIIEFTDTSISISVDYEAEVQELEADSEIFNMNGMMFIGGVVLKSRLDALQSGIHSITHSSRGGSFQGCIRDIEVNNQQLTLADTRVTHGVSMGCIYQFPCYDNPCKADELCTDVGTENYECNCASQSCNADFTTTMDPTLYISQSTKTITTLPPVDVINEPISTKPVTLLEGGRVTITSNNIRLNIDLTLYGLRPSQILFRQQKPPKHGGLYRYVLRKNDKTEQFTLLDLSGSSKITYRHDGSEHFKDKIKLVLEVLGKNNLPEQFENAEFNLDVNVIPVNDPPKLLIPSDNILKIIQRSSIVLSSTELNANDPDTDPSNLTYSVLDSRKIGYVTVDNLRTKDFTQADVNAGRVFFVHTGPTNKSRVTLRVNDGFKYSRPVPLRIEAVPLELSVIHGTKLRVNPGNSVIITKENLDIESNANNQELDVSYEIVANPRYGEIQKNTNGKLWKKVNIFTQRHIDKHKLRYILNNYGTGRKRDGFSVRATCLDQTSEDIRVLVNILITEIRILNNTGLTLNKQRQGLITQESLSADVIDAPFPSPVRFNILRPPLKGHLLKNGDKIMGGQNFTQRDINNGIIEYKINDDVGQTINDSFLFQAFVSNAQSSHLKFNLSFVSEVGPVNVTNLGITVKEGASGLITAQQLYVSVEENEDFEFILTSTLQHGSLQLIDSTSKIVSRNISSFFNSDLVDGAVRYQHDHSEGFNDSFNFLASTSFVDQAGIMHEVQQPGYFNITVILINDHKPKRTVDKPFHVVRNGKKLLTNRDLKFVDDDINFDNADIEYRRQGIRNGQFVWVHDVETQVYRFRQRDIDDEKLLFKHNGVDEARMLLVVRDDDQSRLTTSYFKVIASDPFLTVTTNSELPVKHGATTTITGSYLQLETNMNIKDKNVVVDIVKPAVFGQILNLGSPVSSFTFEDMYLEKIEYQSTEQTNTQENLKDSFDFVVVSRDLVTDGSLTISIYVESHQVPPKIFKNKPFFVEQGKAVVLSKSNLRVYHENSLPGDIIFMVNKLPRYGILQLNSNRHTRKRRDAEFTFTQHDVNQGRVEYIQTKDAGESQDTFTYDVNNGQSMLYNLTFIIEIAPDIIPLTINNITVKEGGSKAITPEIISIDHPYYEGDDYIIQLTANPSHGILDHYRYAGVPITSFRKEDIQDEFVYYVHDGSNTLLDSFSFIANFTKIGKVSNTYKMLVNVITVNDHKPNVLVNKGLGVIINSTAILSGDVLRTVDEDSGPNELVYTLTSANNGHLVMKGARNQSILTFTQQDLDEGKVIFVHTGSRTGGFPFHVTDGTHTSNRQIFSITAKELRIRLTSNQPFKVSTHSLKPITIDNMLVTANQDIEIQGYSITYVITQNPQHGELVNLTSATSPSHLQVSQFTQNDITKGTICYLHTDIHNPATHDSFRFDVFVPFSQNLTNQMVNITITPLQANESMKIHNSGLNVTEGEQVVIRVTNLFTEKLFTFPSENDGKDENLKILYAITELPNKGILKLNNIDMGLNETFTNQNIEKNELTYVHDDSDTEKDFIKIKVALVNEQNLVVTSQSELINITITPVNDEMFEIVTKQLLMKVPQGAEYVVTKNDLQTIDQDTPPDQIVYKLLTQPTNGYIALKSNRQLHVMTFTQGDINSHDILFIQDGSTTPGAITFEVSDGAHKPLFKLLSVKIIPTTIDVMPGKDIFLLQGNTEKFLDRSNLNSTTNGNKLQLAYNITTAPTFGNFVMQGKVVTVFLQDDVDRELVQYVQWDLSVSDDSFSYVATVDETISQEYSLNITVVPAFVLNSFNVTTEDTFQLSTDQINATKLQESTGTDLLFTIADNPAYGAIINASTSIQLSEFTFMDLTEGFVAVEMHHVDLEDNETLTDMYSLLVSSTKAQPVQLNGFFTIFPSPFQPTTEIFETTSFDTGSGTVGGPNFDADFDLSIVGKDIGTEEPLTTLPVYIEENIDTVPSDSSLFPIIIPIIIVIIAFLIIIFVIVLVVVKKKRKESNSGRESPYPDMDGGPYPGASTIPGRAGILPPLNVCAVNYSAASHEFPYNGSGSLHRPVASPAVPQVTVTALGRPPSPSSIKKSSMVSINSNGTGSLSYSLSHDSHGMHTPKLKKSQYWV